MADESSIHTTLRAFAPLTALLGGAGTAARIYDQTAPLNAQQPVPRPFMTVSAISDVAQNTVDGVQLAGVYRIQFDVYADSKASALAVMAQLRLALALKGYERNRRDLPASDPALKRVSCDWEIVIER